MLFFLEESYKQNDDVSHIINDSGFSVVTYCCCCASFWMDVHMNKYDLDECEFTQTFWMDGFIMVQTFMFPSG